MRILRYASSIPAFRPEMRLRPPALPLLVPVAVLATLACSVQVPDHYPASVPDAPARATATPAPGLLTIASLDHTVLAPGRPVRLDVELRNTSTAAIPVSPDGPCDPALRVILADAKGRVSWSEPVPLCARVGPVNPLMLAPGQSLTGSRCFSFDARQDGCARPELPAGTYTVSGGFHGHALPQLQLRMSGHPAYAAPAPGVAVTAPPVTAPPIHLPPTSAAPGTGPPQTIPTHERIDPPT